MKLKSHLRESPPEILRAIAEFWGLHPEDPAICDGAEALADYLYPRLQTPAQFKQTFDRLEVSERELIYFLSLHGGELTIEEFRRRTDLKDDAAFEETCARLNLRGFLWREKICDEGIEYEVIGVPEPFVRLIDLPPYWKGFLGYYLQELGLNELKAIARHGLSEKYEGRRKQVLVHFIRERLLDPAILARLLEVQVPGEKELFQQVLQRNGACVWRDLLDGGAQKKFNHQRAEQLQRLTSQSGLIYVSSAAPNHYNNLLMVPRDVRHVLQNGFRRDERTLTELSRTSERSRPGETFTGFRPSVILDNTQNILRDLCILLAHVQHHAVKVLNNGGIGRNDLKRIAPLLSHNKNVKYAAFLALFAMSRKLLLPLGERWRASKHAMEALRQPRPLFRELYEFWLTTNDWNEEFVEGDVLHVDHYPQNLISITELRKLVLRVLAKVPVESWIDFETFAESLLPQVAIEIPGRFDHAPADKSNRHTILILESLVAESLYWFGLVVFGVSDLSVASELGNRTNESVWPSGIPGGGRLPFLGGEEYVFCFKVTATGRQMFDGDYLAPERLFSKYEDASLPYFEDSSHFTVQPNLEIVTPPNLALGLFFRLLGFCEVKKVDIMTTLLITRESLRLGMEQGMTGSEILEFLRGSSRKEIPETVLHLIDECAGRHGEVDVGPAGGYIVATDRVHVDELRANPRIHRYIKDVFEEKVILLSPAADLGKVTRELEKMGYMPRVASDTLHVTGEGLFHLTVRPEELYDLLAILNFAEGVEEEAGGGIFEERLRPLLERLTIGAKGDFNPEPYVKPLLSTFRKNFEKRAGRQKDEENRKLKKQVNRLLTRSPRRSAPLRYTGENPTSDPGGVVKMIKFAIEYEMQVKIHYQRSTGAEVDEVIEPESLQTERVYAFSPDDNEHHTYAVGRILKAAI